jgi:predicted dehydrogenase
MKVAIIGCGFVAPDHIACLNRVREAKVVGVADLSREAAQKLSAQFGIHGVFTDYRELLAQTMPDVVHVLTPPQTHADIATEAIKAGCHVLLEKPMAPTLEEAERILTVARRHKTKLALCHNFLFIPCVVAARKLVDQGVLGELVSLDLSWRPAHRGLNVPWTRSLPGGPLHEILPHPVYLQRAFVGNLVDIAGVTRTGDDSQGPSCEIRVLLTARYGTAQIEVSPRSEPKQIMLRLQGTKVSLCADISANTLVIVRKMGSGKLAKALMNLDQAMQLVGGTIGSAMTIMRGGISNGHLPLIRAFYQSLRDGSPPPVSGEDGRDTVAILDAIWRH